MMLRHHIRFFVIAMGIAGILYPLALGGIGQFLFPWQTNGSLIYDKGHPVGSFLIGQEFTSDKYFHNRIKGKTDTVIHTPTFQLFKDDPSLKSLFESKDYNKLELQLPTASGVDAFISFDAAKSQAERVAAARTLTLDKITGLLNTCKIKQTFGPDLVHLIKLNLALDHGKTSCSG